MDTAAASAPNPRIFLSYSSRVKAFVDDVARKLGPENIWYDKKDLEYGDELLRELSRAVSSSRVFALFWSKEAETSSWVKAEYSDAVLRKFQFGDVRLVVIRLDDTPVPKRLSPFRHLDRPQSSDEVARVLRRLLEIETPARREIDPTFSGRDEELAAAEDALADPYIGILSVEGLPGMGKRSLVRHLFATRFTSLRPIEVDLDAAPSPANLYPTIADALSVRVPDDVKRTGDWSQYWGEYIEPILDASTTSVVLHGSQYLGPDKTLPAWVLPLFEWANRKRARDRLPLIITPAKNPEIPEHVRQHSKVLVLRRLDRSATVRAARSKLTRAGVFPHPNSEKLGALADRIDGYPLALDFFSTQAARVGLDIALNDASLVEKRVIDLVQSFVTRLALSEEERGTLCRLALLRLPTPIALLSPAMVQPKVLARLASDRIIESEGGRIHLHRLVSEAVVELIEKQDLPLIHHQLAKFFDDVWKKAPDDDPFSALFGAQAYFHYMASGDLESAALIGYSLSDEMKQAARALYKEGEYDKVIEIGQGVRRVLGEKTPPDLLFYSGLSAGRRDSGASDRELVKSLFDELISKYPENRFYLAGYGDALRWTDQIEDAKRQYRRALAHAGAHDPTPNIRLAEIFINEDDLRAAESHVNEATSRAPDDLAVLAIQASFWHAKGELKKALGIVQAGLARDRMNEALNHRAGLILRALGQREKALQHLKEASRKEGSFAANTLADLYLSMGDVASAKAQMNRHRGRKDYAHYNILGRIARAEGRFVDAEEFFRKSEAAGNSTVVMAGSWGGLWLDQARIALGAHAREGVETFLTKAEEALQKGLRHEPENEELQRLKAETQVLRETARSKF